MRAEMTRGRVFYHELFTQGARFLSCQIVTGLSDP